MKNSTSLQKCLIPLFSELQNNTTLIENSDHLDFTNIENGVLIVYAVWSGQAQINCKITINFLYERNYKGQILIIDNDCMIPEIQIEKLEIVCQGWGEIFIIHNGKISKKYLGKDSFSTFKTDYDKL